MHHIAAAKLIPISKEIEYSSEWRVPARERERGGGEHLRRLQMTTPSAHSISCRQRVQRHSWETTTRQKGQQVEDCRTLISYLSCFPFYKAETASPSQSQRHMPQWFPYAFSSHNYWTTMSFAERKNAFPAFIVQSIGVICSKVTLFYNEPRRDVMFSLKTHTRIAHSFWLSIAEIPFICINQKSASFSRPQKLKCRYWLVINCT